MISCTSSWIRTDSMICLSKDVRRNFITLIPNSTSFILKSLWLSKMCFSIWLSVWSLSLLFSCSQADLLLSPTYLLSLMASNFSSVLWGLLLDTPHLSYSCLLGSISCTMSRIWYFSWYSLGSFACLSWFLSCRACTVVLCSLVQPRGLPCGVYLQGCLLLFLPPCSATHLSLSSSSPLLSHPWPVGCVNKWRNPLKIDGYSFFCGFIYI